MAIRFRRLAAWISCEHEIRLSVACIDGRPLSHLVLQVRDVLAPGMLCFDIVCLNGSDISLRCQVIRHLYLVYAQDALQ